MVTTSKKSQSAMEFLMTYGWALFIIIIVIAALVFTGVLRPSRFIPSSIDFGPGIVVSDYSMSFFELDDMNIGHFVLIIKNGIGKNMQDVVINVNECENGNGKDSEPLLIAEGDAEVVKLTCEDIQAVLGEESVFMVDLSYTTTTKGNVVSHTKNAKMKVSAQSLKEFPDTNAGRKAWALYNGASGDNDENRFYPCDDVPGCLNPDPAGTLKRIFGGYVDSMKGTVWQSRDGDHPIGYDWSIERGGIWDDVQPEWIPETEVYKYVAEGGIPTARKDDELGSAFDYCLNMINYSYTDWKLPSLDDFDQGFLQCNECLPPYGTYPQFGLSKFYWTDIISIQYGFSKSARLGGNVMLNFDTDTTRSNKEDVRCIRDNSI